MSFEGPQTVLEHVIKSLRQSGLVCRTYLRLAGAVNNKCINLGCAGMALSGSNDDEFVGRRPKVYLAVRTIHLRVSPLWSGSLGWGFSQMSHVNNVEIRDPNRRGGGGRNHMRIGSRRSSLGLDRLAPAFLAHGADNTHQFKHDTHKLLNNWGRRSWTSLAVSIKCRCEMATRLGVADCRDAGDFYRGKI